MTAHPSSLSDSRFPVVISVPVRFREVDAMGHVNNVAYLAYFEDARVAYHQALAGEATMGVTGFEFILAEINCKYRSPAYFGETLLVGIRVARLGRKSFDFEYEIRDHVSDRLIAEGQSVQVMFDYDIRRSKLLSAAFAEKVEALEGRSLSGEGS